MTEIELTPQMIALIPVVSAVLQVLKKLPAIEGIKQYMPFMAMALSFGAIYAQTGQVQYIPAVLMGLTASGLYSGVKAISTTNTT